MLPDLQHFKKLPNPTSLGWYNSILSERFDSCQLQCRCLKSSNGSGRVTTKWNVLQFPETCVEKWQIYTTASSNLATVRRCFNMPGSIHSEMRWSGWNGALVSFPTSSTRWLPHLLTHSLFPVSYFPFYLSKNILLQPNRLKFWDFLLVIKKLKETKQINDKN